MAALEEAYKSSIMTGKFPACVLNVQIPFNTVDVMSTPAKIEVRFSNERPVFDAVYGAARRRWAPPAKRFSPQGGAAQGCTQSLCAQGL